MNKNYLLCLLILSICVGCSYEFSSDNFIDLEPPLTETQYIELLDFTNMDTINVERTLRYTFNGLPNQNTISTRVLLSGQEIGVDWEGTSGTFTLRPEFYQEGTYTITIEHTFSSGSGSIAEQSGVEVITERAIYQFVVNREPSSAPAMLSAEIIDGSIYLTWSTDYGMDYTGAFLSLQYPAREIRIPLTDEELASGAYHDRSTVLYQGNSNTPDFNQYASVTYSILFESEFESNYGASQSLSYDPSSVAVEIIFNDLSTISFRWSAHPMYANFEAFEFSFFGETFSGSSQGGEYQVQTPYVFGESYDLNGRPSGTDILLPNYTYRDVPLNTDSLGVFDLEFLFVKEIVYNPATNSYFIMVIEDRQFSEYVFSIYEYSNAMEFIRKSDQITYDNVRYEYLGISIDPQDNSIIIDARGSAFRMNPTTLMITEEFTSPALSSEKLLRGNILANLDYTSRELTITNVATNTVLTPTFTNIRSLGYLSPDGRYLFVYEDSGNFLYRIDGNQLVEVLDFSQTSFSGSFEIFEDTLFYGSNNEIVIIDLVTNQSTSFQFGATQQTVQYDPVSAKLLVSQNGQNAIYNTNSQEIIRFESEYIKQARGLFSSEDRDYFMRIRNGRLFHSKGIYLDLDLD